MLEEHIANVKHAISHCEAIERDYCELIKVASLKALIEALETKSKALDQAIEAGNLELNDYGAINASSTYHDRAELPELATELEGRK